MDPDLFGLPWADIAPLLRNPDQFLFLGVDGDHRCCSAKAVVNLGVDVAELRIPVGVTVSPSVGLTVALQTVTASLSKWPTRVRLTS